MNTFSLNTLGMGLRRALECFWCWCNTLLKDLSSRYQFIYSPIIHRKLWFVIFLLI